MSIGSPQDFECMIADIGNTITIEKITDTSYNKYGDATDTTGESTEIKAVVQVFGYEDRMVAEGLYRSGDVTFFIAATEETELFILLRNKIIFNFGKYEIKEIFPHMFEDELYIYEVRTSRV